MQEINFPEDFYEQCQPRDIINFIGQVVSNFYTPELKVFVNRVRYTPDTTNANMVTVNVDLQVFTQGQSGAGEYHTWQCSRATDYSCTQSNFIHLTPDEKRTLDIELLMRDYLSRGHGRRSTSITLKKQLLKLLEEDITNV